MQKKYVIGLNSGTSFDGIDAAVIKFNNRSLKPIFVKGIFYEYPNTVKRKIYRACQGMLLQQEISQLNFLLGEVFTEAALKIIKKAKLKPENILLISSHGQTIFHHPKTEKISKYKIRSTLQIGDSSVIAYKTGIKTISNFREADIAAGGQGAPLMPYLDNIIFNNHTQIKAILNIGGISNVTVAGKNIVPVAFDIGPGNALIDLAAKIYFKRDFDKDGKLAKKGSINFSVVTKALNDPYFKIKPPKSTGREYFNFNFLKKYFSKIKKKEDKIATITYFSAKIIEKAFRDFIFPGYPVKEVVISGGGLKNKTLIGYLKKLMPLVKLCSSDKYHLPYKYKEAILFALLGYASYKKIKNNIPACTGAKKKVILGKMTIV